MASIPGTNVAAPVVPFDTLDQYATHDSRYGKGGWREVATVAERDAIPTARRTVGMAVNVLNDPAPINNGVWVLGNDGSFAKLVTGGGATPTPVMPRTVTGNTALTANDVTAGGIFVNSPTGVTLTVPAGLTPGPFSVVQAGAGIVTMAPGAGVSLAVRSGYLLQSSGISTVLSLLPSSLTSWTVSGDVAQQVAPPVTLPAVVVTPNPITYAEGSTGQLASISSVPSGVTRTLESGGTAWVLNSAKTAIMVGSTPSEPGTYSISVVDTHPNATNSPQVATVAITVTEAAEVTLDPVILMPTSVVYDEGDSGTLAAITTTLAPGVTRTISPNDGRWVLNAEKTAVVVGGTVATPGTYTVTVTDTLAGATNSPQSANLSVTVNAVVAPSVDKILDFEMLGTGAPAGRSHTFGMAFQRGDLMPGDLISVRQGGSTFTSQVDDIGNHWDDGSIRFGAIHLNLPAVANGVTANLSLWRVSGGSAPTPLDMATALSGRTVVVEVKNGANVFTFDCVANLPPAERWFHGPVCSQARMIADIPRAAVGGNTNAKLYVDLAVYADGTIQADVVVWNIRAYEANQGTATYDLKLTADGVDQFSQSAVPGYLYTGWGKRARWGTSGATITLDNAFVVPPTAYLARTGMVANYDTTNPVSSTLLTTYGDRLDDTDWNTPYTSRDLREDMSPGGDHSTIGETTIPNAAWLISGDPRAAQYCMGQAEAYATVPWHCWDEAHGSWVNPIDLPWKRTTGHDSEWVNSAQTLWHIDTGHMGDPVFVPYIMTARRRLLDSLMGQAAYSVTEKAPAPFERGEVTATDADTEAGRLARIASMSNDAMGCLMFRGVQVRTMGWSFRQIVEASAVAPESEQPHGLYFDMVVNANMKYLVDRMVDTEAAQGSDYYGAIPEFIYGSDNGRGAPWQMDMAYSQIIKAARFGNANALSYLQWAQNWIGGRLLDHTGWFGANGTQYNLKFGTAALHSQATAYDPTSWTDNWAGLMSGIPDDYGNNYAGVTGADTASDYERRARGVIWQLYDLFRDKSLDVTLLEQVVAKVNAWPKDKTTTSPAALAADPRSNIALLAPLVITPPVVTSGQTFTVMDNAPNGTEVGTVATTGGAPTGFSIQSGNAGGRFAISNTGVITVANSLVTGTVTLGIQASNAGGTSPTVNVGVTVSASLSPPIVTNSQSFTVNDDAGIGDIVGTVLTTGGAPTSFAITAGNTGSRFAISNLGVITVAAALVEATVSLTVQATNAAGSDSKTVTVEVEAAPVSGPIYATSGTTYSGLYGLRRVVAGYSGSAVRVRRGSDSAEQDIGFDVAGNLDTTALTTFVGASRGYVRTLYDQLGTRHLEQSDTAKQPYITDAAGAVLTKTGGTRPQIHADVFRGLQAPMTGLSAASGVLGQAISLEVKGYDASYGRAVSWLGDGQTDDEASGLSANLGAFNAGSVFAHINYTVVYGPTVSTDDPTVLVVTVANGTQGTLKTNGVAFTPQDSPTNYLEFPSSGTLYVGISTAGPAEGANIMFSELAFFREWTAPDLALIETSMMTYEGIT